MASRANRLENLSKDGLIAEVKKLRQTSREKDLQRLVHDLEVHQEELKLQQVQLLESQKALEEAHDRYAELFDFAPIAYVVLNAYGIIEQANLRVSKLVGVERMHMIGSPLLIYAAPEHRRVMLDHMMRCRRGDTLVESELEFKPRQGAPIPVLVSTASAHPSDASDQRRRMFLTAIVDLREPKRVEEERRRGHEAQQRVVNEERLARAENAAKDRFLAMLSHELRTPLTPILIALDSLRDQGVIPESVRPTLGMIRRNILLEKYLIDDLLDVTRIGQGKMIFEPEVVDVHAVIDEVIALCEEELRHGHLEIQAHTDAKAHHVRADALRLRQVLWNLLHNAARNTPAHGRITIRTANLAPPWLTISVQDSGRGIEKHMLSRIFELFEQGQEWRDRGIGLGLGLAISRNIVVAHGGQLFARSEGTGKGATFVVELHTVAAQIDSTALPTRRPERSQRPRVLLVEDNQDTAGVLAEFLTLHGYDVVQADSVNAALGKVDEADLVVSDIALPDGSGHDLLRQIRRHHDLPAIALSGYGSREDVRRSAEAGFQHHIVKPVDPRHLLETLAALKLA